MVAAGEARAALEALVMARERGWMEVELEGDSLQAITTIWDRTIDPFLPFGAILDNIILMSRSFQFFSCYHVKRSGNLLAHCWAETNTQVHTSLQEIKWT